SAEVGGGALLLHAVLKAWFGIVQDQRQDSIQKSGMRIHGGYVAIERKISGAEADGLLGGVQQEARESGECDFGGSIVVCREAVERVIIARGFVVGLDGFGEACHELQFFRGPGGLAGLLALAEFGEDALGLGVVALLA